MEELLSLKWNNHRSTFIHVLGILRDKQLYTDATLACDGKFYSVHKLVLSTCSDYFSAMLDRTNCKNPVIVLKDIKCEDLEALLDYMYLGEVNVRQSDLATLIKAAECLRVKGLAVPDDEPPVTKKRETQPSRRNDTSSSPPAKRKRRSDVVDDGRDDVRPARADHRQSSPARSSSRPKSPASSSTPLSPVNHRSTPQKQQPSDPAVASSPKTSTCQPGEEGGASGEAVHSSDTTNNQAYATSEQTEPFVKVEMDDGGSADLESYDLSNDGAFKEEDDGGGSTAGDGGDLSNDLPEFLQQAASGPMAGGAFGHSSFSGSSSFQPGDLAGWQGDGSNVGFPHLNFSSAESASQQNAPGKNAQSDAERWTSSHVLDESSQPGCAVSISRNRTTGGRIVYDESDSVPAALLNMATSECPTTSTSERSRHQSSLELGSEFKKAPSLRRGSEQSSGVSANLAPNIGAHKSLDFQFGDAGHMKCPYCPKTFGFQSKLDRHVRAHTNERPFQCNFCPYRAKHRENLKTHCYIKHSDIGTAFNV